MDPRHIEMPKDAAAQRAAEFARKQKWKEQPGNRYTPEELRRMAEDFGDFAIIEPEPETMHLD